MTMTHSSLGGHGEALNVNKTEEIFRNVTGVPKRLQHKNKTKMVGMEKTAQIIILTSTESSKEAVQTGGYINTERERGKRARDSLEVRPADVDPTTGGHRFVTG